MPEKKAVLSALVLAVVLAAVTTPALAQVPVSMVDCVGGTCMGTSGNDTINGSPGQDVIYGLEGDDVIDPGNDLAQDYVYCGPGLDTVNQMPRPLPEDQQGFSQYDPGPDVVADDCETRAL